MKISITFKTPGAVYDAVDEVVDEKRSEEESEELDDYETDWCKEELHDKFRKWVEYGELITIDFDMDAMTATVKEIER